MVSQISNQSLVNCSIEENYLKDQAFAAFMLSMDQTNNLLNNGFESF